MTTTISKHDLPIQQQQQQPQQQLQPQKQLQLPQKQQRSSILLKNSANQHFNTNNSTTTTTTTIATTSNAYESSTRTTTATTATTTRLDSATTIIQIDSLNNNNARLSLTSTTTTSPSAVLLPAKLITTTRSGANNNNSTIIGSPPEEVGQPKSQKRRSLLNFKSLDFHIKSLYSGLRNSSKRSQSQSFGVGGNANGSSSVAQTPTSRTTMINNRMPPYLKIESVDAEESENLLLDYPQSPYSSRRNSSNDDNRTSSQMLHINRFERSRSQASSPSPYFLSPYVAGSPGNVRRSSTSDITSCKPSVTSSGSDSRRPSTSDLLRRARERRGSEARMGRSVSHTGLTRGGFRGSAGGPGAGGRRTSMAF